MRRVGAPLHRRDFAERRFDQDGGAVVVQRVDRRRDRLRRRARIAHRAPSGREVVREGRGDPYRLTDRLDHVVREHSERAHPRQLVVRVVVDVLGRVTVRVSVEAQIVTIQPLVDAVSIDLDAFVIEPSGRIWALARYLHEVADVVVLEGDIEPEQISATHCVLSRESDDALDGPPATEEHLVLEAQRAAGGVGHRVQGRRVAVADQVVQRHPVAVGLLDEA